MKILKFGGSSLAEPERIRAVAEIVASEAALEPVAVVVSALGGVTDLLLEAARVGAREDSASEMIDQVEERHLAVIDELLDPDEQRVARRRVGEAIAELRDLVRGVALVGECTPRTLDRIASYGERLSALLVAAALRRIGCNAEDCDARELIRTDEGYGAALVEPDETYRRIQEHFESADRLQVVTGFIASSSSGETTTLGRSGSDLTAALLGAGLGAGVIEIWTDVDGVMSCDPRRVPEAFSLPRLSYEELMELSHFGAKVVFPPTVVPARRRGIPLLIKNTFNPEFPGTRVDQGPQGIPSDTERMHPITGIASVNHVALLRLEGEGMMGVPGIARRLFDALAEAEVHIILISQASSEHSICFAIDPKATARARTAVEREFSLELATGLLEPLVVEDEQCVVAIVGEGMRERPGIAARLFRVLGRRGISVRAIAQGSSELNISIVLARGHETRALRAIHESFFRGEDDTLKLVLIGVGGVGEELLRQLRHRKEHSGHDRSELRLCGVASSRLMALDRNGLDPDTPDARGWLEGRGEVMSLELVAGFLEQLSGPRALVDCTASPEVQALYPRLLRQGIGVVAANKLAFAGPVAADPRRALRPDGRGLYYEATVGAGIPVVSTVSAWTRCGDSVRRIEGMFSGTLGYLTTELSLGRDFDEVVREAHRLGYTEPDPRQDLSGMDVARKLIILAREAGAEIELTEVDVEGLLGDGYASLDLEAFWGLLGSENERYAELTRSAQAQGKRLVYLAQLDLGDPDASGRRPARASVRLVALGLGHPAAEAKGTANVFLLTSDHYDEEPLVLRGPGAGTRVTAAGMLADILKAHAELVRDPLVEIPPVPRLPDP